MSECLLSETRPRSKRFANTFTSGLHAGLPRVLWKDDADAWYGPSAAVWNVAWNAAPVGISGSLGLVSSKVVSVANGRWLQNGAGCAGHWPCMYFWQWGE